MKERVFVPLNNNVVIKQVESGKTIENNGLITAVVTETETIPEGIVIAKDVNIKVIDKGDTVVFIPVGTYKININGEIRLITNFENLVGKYKKWEQ